MNAMTVADDVRELKAEVRKLRSRVAVLEAAQAARPKRRDGASRRGYSNIRQSESDARWNVWVEYQGLKILEVCGAIYSRSRGDHVPTSLAWFGEHVRDEAGNRFNLRELQRWFSPHCTFVPNSRQDLRIRGAIQREIDRMHGLGYHFGMSQVDAARLHASGPVM